MMLIRLPTSTCVDPLWGEGSEVVEEFVCVLISSIPPKTFLLVPKTWVLSVMNHPMLNRLKNVGVVNDDPV